MILIRGKRQSDNFIWPSFVDALASLLMVIIFILMIFVISQYYVSQKLSGKDQALSDLKAEILNITNQLSIEKNISKKLSNEIIFFKKELEGKNQKLLEASNLYGSLVSELNEKKFNLNELTERLKNNTLNLENLKKELNDEKDILVEKKKIIQKQEEKISTSKSEINKLSILVLKLKDKIKNLNSLLEVYEKKDKEENVKNLYIKSNLNTALARRVEELQKFKSNFFGIVKDKLKDVPEIKIVGDRFVFQSEVLFETGSTEINKKGKAELIKFLKILLEIDKTIPKNTNWILQIEGHTDNLPVKKGQDFTDNWELSTKRALSVLRFFVKEGLDPRKLFASGYGSFQPIDNSNTKKGRNKNRRIEMKITQKLNLIDEVN